MALTIFRMYLRDFTNFLLRKAQEKKKKSHYTANLYLSRNFFHQQSIESHAVIFFYQSKKFLSYLPYWPEWTTDIFMTLKTKLFGNRETILKHVYRKQTVLSMY